MPGEFEDFLKTTLEQGDAIREMIRSDGWKVLEQWIHGQVTAKTLQLLDCSLEEVAERRAEIRTLKSILYRVREYIQCGHAAESQMNSYTP